MAASVQVEKVTSHLNGPITVLVRGAYALQWQELLASILENIYMTATRIGYARCSTDKPDLAAQSAVLIALNVTDNQRTTGRSASLVVYLGLR